MTPHQDFIRPEPSYRPRLGRVPTPYPCGRSRGYKTPRCPFHSSLGKGNGCRERPGNPSSNLPTGRPTWSPSQQMYVSDQSGPIHEASAATQSERLPSRYPSRTTLVLPRYLKESLRGHGQNSDCPSTVRTTRVRRRISNGLCPKKRSAYGTDSRSIKPRTKEWKV